MRVTLSYLVMWLSRDMCVHIDLMMSEKKYRNKNKKIITNIVDILKGTEAAVTTTVL